MYNNGVIILTFISVHHDFFPLTLERFKTACGKYSLKPLLRFEIDQQKCARKDR
jgi:hypothetical protein